MRAPRVNPALMRQVQDAPVLSEDDMQEIAGLVALAKVDAWRERNGLAPLTGEDRDHFLHEARRREIRRAMAAPKGQGRAKHRAGV